MALLSGSLRSGLKLRSVAREVASLSAARLSYPGGAPTQPLCLDIQRPTSGGHALLGSNGHGKTLLASALLDDSLVLSGELKRPGRGARVSFESHQELLAKGGTVYKALGYAGSLSAAAKYLAVRFGLHPLLYRPVRSISTGEIRKVLLARALATRPSLLVLDNAFDGLDGPSREVLKQLIGHTLRGFGQLLVQGIDASATAHTQVLLLTHRVEEIVTEVGTVSRLGAPGDALGTARRESAEGEAMFAASLSPGAPDPPPSAEVAAVWAGTVAAGAPAAGGGAAVGAALVEARALQLTRGEATPLRGIGWTVRRGEQWLIAGGNGAGKSTLGALLGRHSSQVDWLLARVLSGGEQGGVQGGVQGGAAAAAAADEKMSGSLALLGGKLGAAGGGGGGVGWVSTELHLRMASSNLLGGEVLC
jgi:molybdate transport system ATP-binding protein